METLVNKRAAPSLGARVPWVLRGVLILAAMGGRTGSSASTDSTITTSRSAANRGGAFPASFPRGPPRASVIFVEVQPAEMLPTADFSPCDASHASGARGHDRGSFDHLPATSWWPCPCEMGGVTSRAIRDLCWLKSWKAQFTLALLASMFRRSSQHVRPAPFDNRATGNAAESQRLTSCRSTSAAWGMTRITGPTTGRRRSDVAFRISHDEIV
jgi:hypothetical protein